MHQLDSKCSDRKTKLLKYKDICNESKENTKPNAIIELNELNEKQLTDEFDLNLNNENCNAKTAYGKFHRLKEPVRDIQRALDDIDDDMSRIKRRISEAKQSVSKSFELDVDNPEDDEAKSKTHLPTILPPAITQADEEISVPIAPEVEKDNKKDKKESKILKEIDSNINLEDSRQKIDENVLKMQSNNSMPKSIDFPAPKTEIKSSSMASLQGHENTDGKESKIDLDKMNVSNETGNYYLNSLESNQTSSFQKIELPEKSSYLDTIKSNDFETSSSYDVLNETDNKIKSMKTDEASVIEAPVEKLLDKNFLSVQPDGKEIERPRVSLKKKDSYIEKEPLVIDFEGITHSITKDAESLDEQVEKCLRSNADKAKSPKVSKNRLNKSMNCIDEYSSDEYSANALIIDFKSITKNEKKDETKDYLKHKDRIDNEKSTDIQNEISIKSPELDKYQERFKGFNDRMNNSMDTINYYSSDSIGSDKKLNEKEKAFYLDMFLKSNDMEITQSIPTYSDTESVGTTIVKAETTKSSLYLDAEINNSSETYRLIDKNSFDETIKTQEFVNDFVDYAKIEGKPTEPLKSTNLIDGHQISDEIANIFIQLVAITTSLPYQTKNNFSNLIHQFLFHLQKDLGDSKIAYGEEELQNLIYKAKEDFYQLQEERLFDNESKEKRRNVMHENISELKRGIKRFDDKFGRLRQRFLQYNIGDEELCRIEKIEELKVIFDTFSYDFDSFHQHFVRSVKDSMKDHSYTAIENLKTAFNKFDDDFELARRNFFKQLENENDRSYLNNVFNKFDLSFECVRGDLMEDLKTIIDRLMEEMILQKSLKSETSNKTSVNNEWNDNDLYSDKNKLYDAKEIIRKYFITPKIEVIKNLEGMGYVIISSETTTVVDEAEIELAPLQLPEEVKRSDISLQSKSISDTMDNYQILEIEDKCKADIYNIPFLNEWDSKTDLVSQTSKHLFDGNVGWESVPIDTTPNVEDEEEEEIEHEITMNVSLSKDNSSSLKKQLGKSSDTEDDLFPISDKSYELYGRNFANYKGGYTPVPYTPLLEEDIVSGDDRPLEKADLEINLVCGSTSDESISSPKNIPGEYDPTENKIDTSKSPVRKPTDEHNEDYDDIFEALKKKFLQCLEDGKREKKSSFDFSNIKYDILNELESTFGRLDEDFDEIRQSFINSLRNERNSFDTSTLDHIETNLNKFDDDFEDIRQKFIRSLKDDDIDRNESTFTEEETGINLFDDNIDELRHKFMNSLKSDANTEESEKMILNEHVFEIDEPYEDEEEVKSLKEKKNSFKKVKKGNSYKEKEEGHVMKNDRKEFKIKEDIISSDTDGNIENQEEMSMVSHSNDLSWLDLNTLGQFGPEEFSNIDSKCILPSCKEIVILHEPNDMPHFKKHSYTPQHIKDLQEKMNREKEKKKSVEDDYSNDYLKKQKKGSSKIRTKIKSRSKFMADAHIVTDEPKHIETSGHANQSWLDLNTVGQIGPEEEICSDNQFVLPSGKEVIILGKGKDIEDTDHVPLSTESKSQEFKRSLSGRKTSDRRLQRNPSVKRSNSKKVVKDKKQSNDIENSYLDTKSNDSESRAHSITPMKDISDTTVSPNHSKRKNSKNSQTSSPLLDASYKSKDDRESLSRNTSLKREKKNNLYLYPENEIQHEELREDASQLKEETSRNERIDYFEQNDNEFVHQKSPTHARNHQSRSPAKKVLNETFEADVIDENQISKSFEPFTTSTNCFGEDESFVESTSSGGDAIKEDTVIKDNSLENNGGFLDRAKNYMKSIFQFNSSCSDASEKEEIVNKLGVLKEPLDKKKVSDTMIRAKEEQNQYRTNKLKIKHAQNNDSIKTRPKRNKSFVDMDATDNFIEDLSSLVTDETETSELATTGDSSLANLKARRPGPEERYSTENNTGLLNSEIHMIVEPSQLSELEEIDEKMANDIGFNHKPSYKEVDDGGAIDLDATENLIDDIYLATDEPSEPTTQITCTSYKIEEHFLNDKQIVVDQNMSDRSEQECEKKFEKSEKKHKEEDEFTLNRKADLRILEDKAMDNNIDCRLTINDPFKLKPERFRITSDSSEGEVKNENGRSQFSDLPAMDVKISKHIGPEEISSADDKSLLALDKELIMRIDNNQINNRKQLFDDERKSKKVDNAKVDVDEVDRTGMVGFKHGPEEYFCEQNIIVPTENVDMKVEEEERSQTPEDFQKRSPFVENSKGKQASQNTCKEIQMVADLSSLETTHFPQTIISYKNDTLSNKELGVIDEIMGMKRPKCVVQADVCHNILDQSKITNDDVMTDTESIVFDVTVEKVAKEPKTNIWNNHMDQKDDKNTILSQYQKIENIKEDKLEELKALHSIMYSDNEPSYKENNTQFDLINQQTLVEDIGLNNLETLHLDTNGVKTELDKKQSKLVSPSTKQKQKTRFGKSDSLTGKKKSPDGGPGKQYTLLRPHNKRKEWKLDFGGNLRPATIKGKCSKKEFGTFVLVQDSTTSVKKIKKVKRESQIKSNTKIKKFVPSQYVMREKEKEKENKSRAIKVINLTVEKDKEFKRLSKAIKKKLSGKKDDEKFSTNARKVSGVRKDNLSSEKRSSFKKEKSKDSPKRTLVLQNKKDLLQMALKDGPKQKRLSTNEKEITSSSEDISALPHVKRLGSDTNKRKSMVGSHLKTKKDTKSKSSMATEAGKRKKHSEENEPSLKGKQSGTKPTSKTTGKGKQTSSPKKQEYDSTEYTYEHLVYDQQYSENEDHGKDVKRLNNLLTSSFRSRAAHKLSLPYCRSSDDKDWLTEGSINGDELEYEIDWEHLKRGIREHDSSSSYFTAEEISKQSSLESASSSPRGQDCNELSPSRKISNESNRNDVNCQISNTDTLFVAGNVDFEIPLSESRGDEESNNKRENIIDLRFTWDDLGDMRNDMSSNKKTDDEYDQAVNDKSSSDKDSGITSSGEENSRAQIPDSYKMNFLERPIYKLQSISEEDKLTDSEEKETADELSSSVKYLKGRGQNQSEMERESQNDISLFDRKSTKDKDSRKIMELERDALSLDKNIHDPRLFDIPSEMALPYNTNENYSIFSVETFNNTIINEQVFVGEADPSMYPFFYKTTTDVSQKEFKGYDYLATDEFKDALTHIADSSTMYKSEVKILEPVVVSEKLSEQVFKKNDTEEDVYLQEFERLREFERLEEAFQEGKNSSNNSTDDKGLIHITTNLDSETNEKSESIENLGDEFFIRQPMTPITEESGSSIEDGRIDSKRSSKFSIQEKIIENDYDDEANRRQVDVDVKRLLFKPSLDYGYADVAPCIKDDTNDERTMLKTSEIKPDTIAKTDKECRHVSIDVKINKANETKSNKKSVGKANKSGKKQLKSTAKVTQNKENDKKQGKQVSTSVNKQSNLKGISPTQDKKTKTIVSKKKKQEQKSPKRNSVEKNDGKKLLLTGKIKQKRSLIERKVEKQAIISSEKVSKEVSKIERSHGLPSSDLDLMLPLDFDEQENSMNADNFEQLDTSGLEITVTDITSSSSSKQNKRVNQTVRKKSFENKKKKEKEVNKKVLKVIKLFTEAINKKEMTEGTDECISQQIMNSIFNAAKQSSYVEDESQSDLMKTWHESVMNIESHQIEYRDIATPTVGTAVQQYKDLDASLEKKNEKKITKSKNKPRIKSSKLKPSNHHIVLSPRKSKNLDNQKNKNEKQKENRSKIAQRYNNKLKSPNIKSSALTKHTDGATRQKTGQSTSPRRKIKISNLSRKLLNGSYVSPYRQELKKPVLSSDIHVEDEEDDYQEIELDVKIKVTQRDENEDDEYIPHHEQPGNSHAKKPQSRQRGNTFTNGSKATVQSKIPVIGYADVKDRKKNSYVNPKNVKTENQPADEKTLFNKKRQDVSTVDAAQKLKRSSSERSTHQNEIKGNKKKEERRHSSYHFVSTAKRFTPDKTSSECKHPLACNRSFIDVEEKIVTRSSDVEKKEKQYVANLGARGPIFPYIGYIERKDLGITTVDHMKSNNSVSKRRCIYTNPSIQTTIESTMITSSKPKVGQSCLESNQTDADSSFAIMSSNTGDNMFLHCHERETKREDHHIHLDTNTNFVEEKSKYTRKESKDLHETHSKMNRPSSVDISKNQNTAPNSLDKMENSYEENLNLLGSGVSDNGTPKKSISSKIFHTLPANTGGANLYVESRGAILPYIGHIERLDNEMIKSEAGVKPSRQSSDSTNTRDKEVCSTTDLLGKKSKPLLSTSEVPTATVRSSTPNNVALEVKIPIPAELSSSMDPSDSPTLTFNIDVSLENSSDEAENPAEEVKKSSPSKEGKEKNQGNDGMKNKCKGNSSRNRKLKFDRKGNVDETYISKEKTYDSKKSGTFQSKNRHKLDETNINIDVEVDCTNIPAYKINQSKEMRGGFFSGSQVSLPDLLSESVEKTPPNVKTRSIYPYNHFIMQKPAVSRRGSSEQDSQGKKLRKSWPTDGAGKPFQNHRNGSFSSYDSQPQKSDRTTKTGKTKSEERVCLGGGLVFNVTKKQAHVTKKQVQSRLPMKHLTVVTRATEPKKTPERVSIPPRSITKYIPRHQENADDKGSCKGSLAQQKQGIVSSNSFNDSSDNCKHDELKLAEKVNEEKVNNLVSDIKDAGATISDILDEMQALKMFLNEEEENVCIKEPSQARNNSELHMKTNHNWRNESDNNLCHMSQSSEKMMQGDWMSYQSDGISSSRLLNHSNDLNNMHFHESQKSPDSKTTSEITSTSQSFKEKLKEELARSISATLDEIHPYRNIFSEESSLVVTSKNTEQIPSMDDTLREIRTSNEDVESDLIGTAIQTCEESYPDSSPSKICSIRDFSTINSLTISRTMQTTCVLTTTAGVLTVQGSVVSSKEKNYRPPPKSYVRPIIFPKTFKSTPCERALSDQSLDSGLHVTNSIDDFSLVTSEPSNKTLRESFEQQELSLGIIDDKGRLRRNSELIKQLNSEQLKLRMSLSPSNVNIKETDENDNQTNNSRVQNNEYGIAIGTSSEVCFPYTSSEDIKTLENILYTGTCTSRDNIEIKDHNLHTAEAYEVNCMGSPVT